MPKQVSGPPAAPPGHLRERDGPALPEGEPALFTVTRVVSAQELGDDPGAGLLTTVRRLVREARAAHPGLKGFRLFDVGLVRRGPDVLVHLYFYR